MSDISSILVCGDIHDKPTVIAKIRTRINDFDRIVFLGDYVDDWDSYPEISHKVLTQLITLKKHYPDKITLCTGNHDNSNAFAGRFKCSGFNGNRSALIKDLYRTKHNNEYVFQLAEEIEGILFTHAGVTQSFHKDLQILLNNHYPELTQILNNSKQSLATRLKTVLNQALLNGFKNPDDKLFLTLAQAGPARGGIETPSPIWTDKDELIRDHPPRLTQVVGHTPVQSIEIHRLKNTRLAFCDTHSYAYYPTLNLSFPIGDGSFLLINIQRKRKLMLKIQI